MHYNGLYLLILGTRLKNTTMDCLLNLCLTFGCQCGPKLKILLQDLFNIMQQNNKHLFVLSLIKNYCLVFILMILLFICC